VIENKTKIGEKSISIISTIINITINTIIIKREENLVLKVKEGIRSIQRKKKKEKREVSSSKSSSFSVDEDKNGGPNNKNENI